ncbi:I78 family peptidase inhibitor [Kineococcus sp. SYSU DK001]|uniref:I78 family peptidase inhibitor n=1 Tax=Kineococcus sp. SYSU DK001 TaxID=3383122 RepID=UPI003D7C42B8
MREFEGLPWPEAVERARAQGRAVRVIRPGTAVTLDYRPDRLNVHLDADDRLDHLSAG